MLDNLCSLILSILEFTLKVYIVVPCLLILAFGILWSLHFAYPLGAIVVCLSAIAGIAWGIYTLPKPPVSRDE